MSRSSSNLRQISLSAADYHAAPFVELPPPKDTSAEKIERAILKKLRQLQDASLINAQEFDLLKACLQFTKAEDEVSIRELQGKLAGDQKSSPVALAIVGVASSSITSLKRLADQQKRQTRTRRRGIGIVALWDLLGAAGGAAIGGGIGGVAGAVVGAIVVGGAFSLGAAYDEGLI